MISVVEPVFQYTDGGKIGIIYINIFGKETVVENCVMFSEQENLWEREKSRTTAKMMRTAGYAIMM